MDRGALEASVHGVTKGRTRLSSFTFTFIHWRRQWQPTPVFLPGESQGRRSLVGCRLWGLAESDTTEVTEYIMRNAGLEEAQAGIKIARRNINNLRYADDTTLMAESEEELKSLLMKVPRELLPPPPSTM